MGAIAERERPQAQAAASQLEQLKHFTKVVADTGDFGTLEAYGPEDATTNPSLILKAAQMPEYQGLLDRAIEDSRKVSLTGKALLDHIADGLLVLFGTEILKRVPGRVSTETDADLSFDTPGLIAKARRFIALYEQSGISRERVLIKIASTWEGIKAAEALQPEGINCNLTLLFSLTQALACAEAKVKLISPFVGRILDWYKAKTGRDFAPGEDPGVLSVKEIYSCYRQLGYQTEIMGASFRNKGEILELAGCDLLTISPSLLRELKNSTEAVERKLSPMGVGRGHRDLPQMSEKQFRWELNENAMATEKLAEGIRTFNADAVKLEQYIQRRL